MPYRKCLESSQNGRVQVESANDDAEFAVVVAAALRSHPESPPRQEPPISNALQGNLCEFCTWDLGEKHWHLYGREWTWTPNASSPWRPSSDPGIDILALSSIDDTPIVLVVEVKSSHGGGSNLVVSDNNSLRTDFERLFAGDIKSRLQNRIGAVVSDLHLKHKRPLLAEHVKCSVGTCAADSEGINLIGVLICERGNARSQSARLEAFQRLQTWLHDQGWEDQQVSFRCVETQDFSEWLSQVIKRAIHDHS